MSSSFKDRYALAWPLEVQEEMEDIDFDSQVHNLVLKFWMIILNYWNCCSLQLFVDVCFEFFILYLDESWNI